jgi:hypothetical protein
MNLITSFNFEQLVKLIQESLQQSINLYYVDDRNIVIVSDNEKLTTPTLKDYLIRLSAPDGGFINKQTHIGNYYTNYYSVAIDLWIKSSSKVTSRLTEGNIQEQKGIFEFFQDVSDTLEHNTFENQLDSFPGSNIGQSVPLSSDDSLLEGIGFIWQGRQNNLK